MPHQSRYRKSKLVADRTSFRTFRLASIDCLRLLAIFAVAAGHYWSKDPTIRIATFSWHVPMFFFLTGYLWSPKKTMNLELRSRGKSLLIPYACWLITLEAMFICSTLIRARTVPYSALVDIFYGGVRLGSLFAAFWFVPVLFISVIFVRLVYTYIGRLSHLIVFSVSFVSIIACMCWSQTLRNLPLDFFMAGPCSMFILSGQLLHWLETRLRVVWLIAIGLVLLSMSIPSFAIGLAAPLDIKLGILGTPILSLIMSIALCGGMVIVAKTAIESHITRRLGQITSRLAQVILPVMFVHPFAFLLFKKLGLSGVTCFTISVVSSFFGALVLNSLPLFSPFFVGIPRWNIHPSRRCENQAKDEYQGHR